MAWRERDDNDTASPAPHLGGADDRFLGVIAALHNNVRLEVVDQVEWSILGENDNQVDALQRAEDVGALGVTANWPCGTFETANGVVAVDSDNEGVSCLPGCP